MKTLFEESDATLSPCGEFRFQLTRVWDAAAPHVCFIGLNPSTGDATADDPTIRRMIGFARQWKHGGIYVVNLFAFRSPQPLFVDPANEPTDENDRWILDSVLGCETTVACWGAEPIAVKRGAEVLAMLKDCGVGEVLCFGTTKDGHPKHPLYLSGRTELVEFPDYKKPSAAGD